MKTAEGMLTFGCYEELASHLGEHLGESPYMVVTQEMIDTFADATDDHQWIHVDQERAKRESPYGTTIAHGYLTLSIIPVLWFRLVKITDLERVINYGINNLRFTQPVLSGQSVRLLASLKEISNLRGAVRTTIHVVIEIKETGKKALEGDFVFVYYFRK